METFELNSMRGGFRTRIMKDFRRFQTEISSCLSEISRHVSYGVPELLPNNRFLPAKSRVVDNIGNNS